MSLMKHSRRRFNTFSLATVKLVLHLLNKRQRISTGLVICLKRTYTAGISLSKPQEILVIIQIGTTHSLSTLMYVFEGHWLVHNKVEDLSGKEK